MGHTFILNHQPVLPHQGAVHEPSPLLLVRPGSRTRAQLSWYPKLVENSDPWTPIINQTKQVSVQIVTSSFPVRHDLPEQVSCALMKV